MGRKRVETKTKVRLLALLAGILLYAAAYFYVHGGLTDSSEVQVSETTFYAKGTVTKLYADKTVIDETAEGAKRGSQEIEAEVTSGALKGKHYIITNYMSALYQIDAKVGTHVILRFVPKTGGGYAVSIYSYDRSAYLYGAILVFALLLTIIGGKKGAMALCSLAYTVLCVLTLLLPALYKGAPTLPTTLLIITATTVLSFLLIDGLNRKTVSAMLGTVAGVCAAGLFAWGMGKLTHITGFQTTEAESLLLLSSDHGLKITNLFTAGILLSAMGAVMDVAMSIASAVHEVREVGGNLKFAELFRSGMNIGRDAMGTMANTLILAFVGSSLNLLLMIYTYNIPFVQLWNTDLVAREIIQGISGSIGIVMTVPLVALVSAWIEGKEKK